jgi:hypothetical protein
MPMLTTIPTIFRFMKACLLTHRPAVACALSESTRSVHLPASPWVRLNCSESRRGRPARHAVFRISIAARLYPESAAPPVSTQRCYAPASMLQTVCLARSR